MDFPQMVKVRQTFHREFIEDIEAEVKAQLQQQGTAIKPGSRIAIAVGSRGVANIHRIVKATVEYVRELGAQPFIIPAMGSHGGATAEGQKELLRGYGVSEEAMGAEVISSMEVVELPQGELPNKVYMDKNAYQADGTIIINRVKVHTDFHGQFESGLIKMCVIGLGKHKQALEIHRFGVHGLKDLIPDTARQILKHGNIILGIGVVENAYDQTALIRAAKPEDLERVELELLDYNRKNMPSLPVHKIDVLIVDKMGKDISGVGMDTNIIGRMKIRGEEEPKTPDITNIIVSDLTDASHGNALGVGLADITTRKLFGKIDFEATYQNVITSTFLDRGKIPIIVENDRSAVHTALRTCGPIEREKARMVRIQDTLHIDELYVSVPLLEELQVCGKVEVIGDPCPLLDKDGNLTKF